VLFDPSTKQGPVNRAIDGERRYKTPSP
jgi:hypothetical protein